MKLEIGDLTKEADKLSLTNHSGTSYPELLGML